MNLLVNKNEESQIEQIEGEILSTTGRVKLFGMEIPPYPKLMHLSSLDKGMVAQKKVNGYNVRLVFVSQLENFIAVLRGGYVCAKTTYILRKNFQDLFIKFFRENPKKILCMEVIGKKTLANVHIDYYNENYGFEDVGYFVFDIMDMEKQENERFFSFEDVKNICNKYGLQIIPDLGVFENFDELNKKLHEISNVFEGAVVKSLDGKEILKYRFSNRPDLFGDKIPKRDIREKSEEDRLVGHFFQGYEEKELGLESGISQEEMGGYQKMLDQMGEVIKKDKTKIGEESRKIVDYLMNCFEKHGKFEKKVLEKIEKMFSQKVGSQIGKMLRAEKR